MKPLSRGEQAVAGIIVFLAVFAVGLFTHGLQDAWIYVIGIGVGLVLGLVHRWAEGTDS